jgi:Ca2+-binding RTX toxin-like protein
MRTPSNSVECLEGRTLFSLTSLFGPPAVIEIAGTSGDDTIVVSPAPVAPVQLSPTPGVSFQASVNGAAARTYLVQKGQRVVVSGLAGKDNLILSPGLSMPLTYNGGTEDDTLTVLNSGKSSVNYVGGDGDDTADYFGSTTRVFITLDDLTNDGVQNESNIHSDVETVIGTPYRDTLIGNDLRNKLVGRGGGDWLRGLDGPDELRGGEGDDWLFGGFGDDKLHGGDNDDNLNGGWGQDELRGDGGDFDTADYSDRTHDVFVWINNMAVSGDREGDTIDTDVEMVVGGSGNDTIHGSSPDGQVSGRNILLGGKGDDKLFGHGGNDDLFGEDDNDTLVGGSGNDLLDGGSGTNTLDAVMEGIGSQEVDSIRSSSMTDTILKDPRDVLIL